MRKQVVAIVVAAMSMAASAGAAQAWGGHGRGHHEMWHPRPVTYVSYDEGYRPYCPPRQIVYSVPYYPREEYTYYTPRPVYVVQQPYPRPIRSGFGVFVNY